MTSTMKSPSENLSNDWSDKVRSQRYLNLVRENGCLVCFMPAQAHHMTHVMEGSRGFRRTGDQFAVPLCQKHHEKLHKHGNESNWWSLQGIDPIEWADRTWTEFLKNGKR